MYVCNAEEEADDGRESSILPLDDQTTRLFSSQTRSEIVSVASPKSILSRREIAFLTFSTPRRDKRKTQSAKHSTRHVHPKKISPKKKIKNRTFREPANNRAGADIPRPPQHPGGNFPRDFEPAARKRPRKNSDVTSNCATAKLRSNFRGGGGTRPSPRANCDLPEKPENLPIRKHRILYPGPGGAQSGRAVHFPRWKN